MNNPWIYAALMFAVAALAVASWVVYLHWGMRDMLRSPTWYGRLDMRLTAGIGLVLFSACGFGVFLAIMWIQRVLGWYGFAPLLGNGTTLIVSVAIPLLSWLLEVRTSAMKHLGDTPEPHPRCAQCGYNLSGLPQIEDSIRCPECGKQETVEEINRLLEYDRAVNRYLCKLGNLLCYRRRRR
jgi:predicted RNA-binding Zn-ribbon protein involved in translation (DUF1610 family)